MKHYADIDLGKLHLLSREVIKQCSDMIHNNYILLALLSETNWRFSINLDSKTFDVHIVPKIYMGNSMITKNWVSDYYRNPHAFCVD